MDEVEIKIMEINPRKIRKILKEKAKFVKKVLQRNYIYTNPVMRLKGRFVRIRTEGKNVSPSNILKVAKLLGFSKKDFFPRRVEDYYKGLKKKKSLTFSNEI